MGWPFRSQGKAQGVEGKGQGEGKLQFPYLPSSLSTALSQGTQGSLVFPAWPQTDSGTSKNVYLCNYITVGSGTSEGLPSGGEFRTGTA